VKAGVMTRSDVTAERLTKFGLLTSVKVTVIANRMILLVVDRILRKLLRHLSSFTKRFNATRRLSESVEPNQSKTVGEAKEMPMVGQKNPDCFSKFATLRRLAVEKRVTCQRLSFYEKKSVELACQ